MAPVLEPIRRVNPAEPDRVAVEHRVTSAVERNPEAFLRAYQQHPDSDQGRYVSADLMKEMFADYAASREARGRYNGIVHNSAAVLASAQFREAIADNRDPNRTEALFVTGCPGAGKTSAVLANGIPANARLVYEGQLTDKSSHDKIAAALDAGLNVKITAVLPTVENALENTRHRFENVGRGASLAVMAKIQDETPNGLAAIKERFGDRVVIEIVDVRDRANARSHDLTEGAKLWMKEIEHGQSAERLRAHLAVMRSDGRTTPNFERQAEGKTVELGRAVGSGIAQTGDRPRSLGESREAGVLTRDPERHSLPAAELQRIYETRVSPRLFTGAQSIDQPTVVILGGQPGSGKTPMQNLVTREFDDRGGMVKIIGDDLRAYLPQYKGLQRSDDKTAAFYTDRDTGRLIEKAISEAKDRRVNVLVEGTMRDPAVVERTLNDFRDAGYRTDARALAVSPELSSLGILQRYAAQKESRGVGRMTTREAHDAALTGMLQSVDRIQDGRLADSLSIYRRGGERIANLDLTAPAKLTEPRARHMVERERERTLTHDEQRMKQAEITRLTPILQKHGVIPQTSEQTRQHTQQRAKEAGRQDLPTPPPKSDERER